MKKHNFGAGPSILQQEVFEQLAIQVDCSKATTNNFPALVKLINDKANKEHRSSLAL